MYGLVVSIIALSFCTCVPNQSSSIKKNGPKSFAIESFQRTHGESWQSSDPLDRYFLPVCLSEVFYKQAFPYK